jgi:hypothetical protein
MPDQEKQTERVDEVGGVRIVIEGGVVRLLRTGAYASLGLAADDVGACTSPAGRELDPGVFRAPLERLDGARSLLSAVGWRHVDPERPVELEIADHRIALCEAAQIALELSEDAEPAGRPLPEHLDRLRELIRRVAP